MPIFAGMNEDRIVILEREVKNHGEQLDRAARCVGQLYGITVGILIVILMMAVLLYFRE
jgi:tetrahydromethanopterin S-methyltransferase subunit G